AHDHARESPVPALRRGLTMVSGPRQTPPRPAPVAPEARPSGEELQDPLETGASQPLGPPKGAPVLLGPSDALPRFSLASPVRRCITPLASVQLCPPPMRLSVHLLGRAAGTVLGTPALAVLLVG